MAEPFVWTKVDETRRGLLVSAFEGGSNYWYTIVDHEFPQGVTYDDFREGGRFANPDDYWHPETLIPFHPGCATLIAADGLDEGKQFRLDHERLVRGWDLMKEKYPRHFADVIAENDDAITADVYLQCCLFGELIFG